MPWRVRKQNELGRDSNHRIIENQVVAEQETPKEGNLNQIGRPPHIRGLNKELPEDSSPSIS
jgi:hypothetical protein